MSDDQSHDSDAGGEEVRPVGRLRKVEEAIGAAVMAVICLISFANVVVRYATDVSFAFTEEYSVFLLVIMTFVGSSLAFATDRHIRIAYFTERMGPRGRRLAEAVSLLATTAVFALIVFYGARFAYAQWELEETSPGLGHPSWIYSVWLPLLAAVILFRVGQRALCVWRSRR